MHPTTQLLLRPSTSGRMTRLLLAAVVLATALAITVTRSEPAGAWTIQRNPDEIVITSERLHDVTVRATLIVTLRRNGDVIFEAHDVHNSGATRKYFSATVKVTFPEAAFNISLRLPDYGHLRIGKRSTASWDKVAYEARLAQRWDRVQTDDIGAHFSLDATRVQG